MGHVKARRHLPRRTGNAASPRERDNVESNKARVAKLSESFKIEVPDTGHTEL